jgi:ATP sulfurylase
MQVENMRLTNGLLFGLPIVFDTDDEGIKAGDKILLKQANAHILYCMLLSIDSVCAMIAV